MQVLDILLLGILTVLIIIKFLLLGMALLVIVRWIFPYFSDKYKGKQIKFEEARGYLLNSTKDNFKCPVCGGVSDPDEDKIMTHLENRHGVKGELKKIEDKADSHIYFVFIKKST